MSVKPAFDNESCNFAAVLRVVPEPWFPLTPLFGWLAEDDEGEEEEPDGDESDEEEPDENEPDGDEPDGDESEGERCEKRRRDASEETKQELTVLR